MDLSHLLFAVEPTAGSIWLGLVASMAIGSFLFGVAIGSDSCGPSERVIVRRIRKLMEGGDR